MPFGVVTVRVPQGVARAQAMADIYLRSIECNHGHTSILLFRLNAL